MRTINNYLNFLSNLFFGIGIFDVFSKAYHSKQEAKKANQYATNKQLFQAVKIARGTLSQWSSSPSFFERLFRKWAMDDLLEQLEKQLKSWQQKISKVNEMAANALSLETENEDNLVNNENFIQALQLYLQCSRLIYHPHYIEAITRLEQKLKTRHKFHQLIAQGKEEVQLGFFKQALITFEEAKQLFSTKDIEEYIAICRIRNKEQYQYETSLNQANQLATEGRFYQAITLLKEALTQFFRTDGQELLNKLEKVVTAREYFYAGLQAEKAGHLKIARDKYQTALIQLPEFTECRIRLGIVALKSNNSSLAISSVEGISGEQTAYLRGLAYANQGSWQQAEHEWKTVRHPTIKKQLQTLKNLVEKECLLIIQKIEASVDREELETAKLICLEFLDKFGSYPLVEANFYGHILPRLEAQRWESQDWHEIAATTEQNWLEKQDITSLHNWAVACYYQAQIDSTKLANLIISLFTALANIHLDSSLQEVPWLGNTSVDLKEASSNLTQLLEKLIDDIKDIDIEEYFRLRDVYRLEIVALRVMNNPPSCGMRVKQVFITPGCYQRYRNQLPQMTFPPKLWGALYTNWGFAVAACVEGDIARAIQIKPTVTCSCQAETFAYSWVSYHEGCYYFQEHNWRKAIHLLKQVKAEIKACPEWLEKIDKLCSLQRQKIDEFDEHLQFSEFWYELVGSKAAKSYLAECKADLIREQLVNKQISLSKAVSQLKSLQKIDENNSVVLELITKLEILQQLEEIDNLMKCNRFEDAVRRAKYSQYEEVRYRVAEVLIDILFQGIKSHQLDSEAIVQLGHWAKELCPHEPAFQEIYRSLGLHY